MNPTRRDFLRGASVAALAAAASGVARAQAAPAMPVNPLPRWRGFNLQYLYRTGSANLPPVEDHFRWIADWGFDFVRLPMCYRNWLQKKSRPSDLITADEAMAIDESALEAVDRAVEYGGKHGVHICLCFHHAPGYRVGKEAREPFLLWRDAEAVQALALHWESFARRYRAVPPARLSFNLFNEAPWPNDDFNGAIYRHAITPAVEAIRRHSPDRLIIADGAGAGNLCVPELVPLRIHQSVHCYIPGVLSHYRVDWMQDRKKWPEPCWPGATDDAGVTWDRQRLDLYYSPWRELLAQDVGVHLGETGASHRLPAPIQRAWLADVLGLCRDLNIGFALWDFIGQSKFGILDSERTDVVYEDWYGHRLDRDFLTLLQNL